MGCRVIAVLVFASGCRAIFGLDDPLDGDPGDGPGVPPLSCMDRIVAGGAHACVHRTDGSLRCWGRNAEGQLTGALANPQEMPGPVADPANVGELGMGNRHTCAGVSGGEPRCWGLGVNGELGDGLGATTATPVTPMGLPPIRAIDGGQEFTCAIAIADGGVYCWGRNVEGQVGDTTVTSPRLVPSRVQLAAGGDLIGATAISTGFRHACAIAGMVAYCWGSGANGRLGNDTVPTSQPTAVAVPGLTSVRAIVAGHDHTCAIDGDSEADVLCWGKDDQGQVGNGAASTVDVRTPQLVGNLPERPIVIASGDHHICVLSEGSEVHCWGRNVEGQIDDPATPEIDAPRRIMDLGQPNLLATGANFTCALVGATVSCRGVNTEAQLGIGAADGTPIPHPTPQVLALGCP